MSNVKASVYTPPVEPSPGIELPVLDIEVGSVKEYFIYVLMILTIILFIKKLISAVCRRPVESEQVKWQ
jgi:hypothetical protein